MIIKFASLTIAILAFVVSYFSLRHAKKQTEGNVLIGFLSNYIHIAKTKEKAIEDKSVILAGRYYRELLDLLWSEYRMWKSELIPDHIMKVWAKSTFRNLKHGEIRIWISDSQTEVVRYRDIWAKLKTERYFDEEDSFMEFMLAIESGEVNDAMKIKKRHDRL